MIEKTVIFSLLLLLLSKKKRKKKEKKGGVATNSNSTLFKKAVQASPYNLNYWLSYFSHYISFFLSHTHTYKHRYKSPFKMNHSSVFLVFKWSRSNESTGSSQHVIPWDCIELWFSNIKKSASKTEFQTFAFFVNMNWVIVARCSESLIKIITTKGSQHVYWSVPAALLVRFRGDALGEALSETQEVKIKYS